MAQTPISPSSYFLVNREDENDPESPLTAYLVQDDGVNDPQWKCLGNSFGADSRGDFLWMVSCLATFHGRALMNESGELIP